MTTWAVIATGESLKPDPAAVTARVRHLPTVAVSDAFMIAPWARALVACDGNWWRHHPDALAFPGEKWCANGAPKGVTRMVGSAIYTNTNSGLLGLRYAAAIGATRILLLGIDMRGTHYFGPHKTLPNPNAERFALFIEQFRDASKRIGATEVINCNPESALDVFPKMTLDDALELEERLAA